MEEVRTVLANAMEELDIKGSQISDLKSLHDQLKGVIAKGGWLIGDGHDGLPRGASRARREEAHTEPQRARQARRSPGVSSAWEGGPGKGGAGGACGGPTGLCRAAAQGWRPSQGDGYGGKLVIARASDVRVRQLYLRSRRARNTSVIFFTNVTNVTGLQPSKKRRKEAKESDHVSTSASAYAPPRVIRANAHARAAPAFLAAHGAELPPRIRGRVHNRCICRRRGVGGAIRAGGRRRSPIDSRGRKLL